MPYPKARCFAASLSTRSRLRSSTTPLVRRADARASATSEFILARTPIGWLGQPREVVGAAIFLASAAASMVTGHVLQVDGGYLCA